MDYLVSNWIPGSGSKNWVGLDTDLGTTTYKQHWISWMRWAHQGLSEAKRKDKIKLDGAETLPRPVPPPPHPRGRARVSLCSNLNIQIRVFLGQELVSTSLILLTQWWKYIFFPPQITRIMSWKRRSLNPSPHSGWNPLPAIRRTGAITRKPHSRCSLCWLHPFPPQCSLLEPKQCQKDIFESSENSQ